MYEFENTPAVHRQPTEDYRKKRIEKLSEDDLERGEILRRRLLDPTVKKRFRNAYALKAGANYQTLKPYCENIIMAADGFAEHPDIARAKLELAMKDYDPDKDVLVVIGRSFDNILVGLIACQRLLEKPKVRQSFAVAVYYNFSYKFYEVSLDPEIETREIV